MSYLDDPTVSTVQFWRFLHTLSGREIPLGYWPYLGFWANLALSALVLVLAVYFVLSASA